MTGYLLHQREMSDPRPPGHTCPAIDRAQSAMRKLAWRVLHPEHDGVSVGEVLAKGLADLEQVREENTQMRAAYHAALKEQKT